MGVDRGRLKLATLWVLREFQPISIEDIVRRMVTGDGLPEFLRDLQITTQMYLDVRRYVEQFIRVHLVNIQDGGPLTRNSLLETTNDLTIVQEIFSISLTGLLTRKPDFIEAYPIFGRAAEKTKGWAQIFVAMPFREDLLPVYEDHILKVAGELNLSCKRGDDIFSANIIMHDVWSAIYRSQLCIVDCTDRNPNVFYELGIAHTLGRKAILITRDKSHFPFDVQHLRTIIYEYTPRGMRVFEDTLKKTIQQELGLE